ncbi:MAG: response regulator transcription factor [Bacteroidales bacterium]|nr:response regulator transcription factor [Bacteroidales bacterium]MBR4214665.1 response regulator transcription factor [Bacteroidales bacterium]
MEKKVSILLAEDDVNLGSLLKQYLEAKGYSTDLFNDGEKATVGFRSGNYDICILDIMMPKKDGFAVATEIREINTTIPIIFLTAKNMKEDVLTGFKIGADDYITKPFNMEELLLRIEAVLRRSGAWENETVTSYKIGKYSFNTINQTLQFQDGEPEKLTTKESELLRLLCANSNKVLERNYALKQIWDDDNYFNARSMDVYITKLRKKLQEDSTIEILNIHGKGYKLIVGGEE